MNKAFADVLKPACHEDCVYLLYLVLDWYLQMRMLSCMKKTVADTLKGVMVMILFGLSLVFSIRMI